MNIRSDNWLVIDLLNSLPDSGLNSIQEMHNFRLNDVDENGLNSYDRMHSFRLSTINENGLNVYDDILFKTNKYHSNLSKHRYYKLVQKYTKENDLNLLQNIHLRSTEYHLDHKFSINAGYMCGIQPCIIGSVHNLEILNKIDNIKKSSRCSMTEYNLYDMYFNYHKRSCK